MSNFDPEAFLAATVSGANSTKIIPCPMGDFPAIIDKVVPRQWANKQDPSQAGIALDVFWKVEDQGAKEQAGRDELTVKQGIMLDLAPSGGLDMSEGKNVGLGRLREAVGLNDPSQSFSFHQLPGLMGRISVTHRQVGEDTFADVKAVTKFQ